MTIDAAIDWLKRDKNNAIKVNGWCIKTVDELLSDKKNLHMESKFEMVNGKKKWKSRYNSIKGEIEQYPEKCSFMYLNGDHDTDYTDELKCPYCGHEHEDSWEYPNDGHTLCDFCEKEFFYIRNTSVSYSSHKENEPVN